MISRYSGFSDQLVLDFGPGKLSARDKQAVHSWVNAKPSRQMPFIRQYYFPKIRVYKNEIQSTTHFFPLIAKADLVTPDGATGAKRAFQRLQGMSGTLFNRHTYPRNVFSDMEGAVSDTTYVVAKRILQVCPSPCPAGVLKDQTTRAD